VVAFVFFALLSPFQLHYLRHVHEKSNWYRGNNRVLFACRWKSRFVTYSRHANCRLEP